MSTATRLTATGTVPGGMMKGFYVSSTTGGTLVLRIKSGGTQISGTITPAVGWHEFPCQIEGGPLHVTVANTIDVTFFCD